MSSFEDSTAGVADTWSPDTAARLVAASCAAADLAGHPTELIRFGTSAVYRLDGTPLVLRLTRPDIPLSLIRDQTHLARWLVEQGFPANRPVHGPFTDGLSGATATFWTFVPHDPDARADPSILGSMLQTLHALTDTYPVDEIEAWHPVEDILARFDQADASASWLASDDLSLLRHWAHRLRQDIARLDWALRPGLIHGDAHVGNVLCGDQGPVLIDWDLLSVGPREWDLIPTLVSVLRFKHDRDAADRFEAGYGFAVRDWAGWPTLQKLRELYTTSWLISVASDDARRDEVRHRLTYWRDPTHDPIWHAV